MAIVGPGAQQQNIIAPEPSLQDASEFEYVTILNPLSDDFVISVAQDVPVSMPFEIRKDGVTSTTTNTEADVRSTYGLALKNADHQSKKRIINNAVIRSGKTINLKGSEAKVAVTQLVNEIIQRENKKQFLSDPTTRKEVENRIIIARGSIQELMDSGLKSVNSQLDDVINKSNEEPEDEFPGIKETRTTESPVDQGDNSTPGHDLAPQKRVGRPPKQVQGR